MKDSSYELKTIEYKPGDLIVFHTDGLSDNLYKGSSEEFSEYLKEILLNSRAETPDEVLNILLSSFYKYNPSASEKYDLDDVSIILCKINESGDV